MRYLIESDLEVTFAEPVREHHIQLRLAPWEDEWQKVGGCTFDVEPFAEPIRHRDGFGNPVHCLEVLGAHASLSIKLRAEVETLLENPFDYPPIAPERELDWIAHGLRQAPRLWDFVLHRSVLTPDIADIADRVKVPGIIAGKALIEQVQAAMEWIGLVCDFDPECPDAQPALSMLLENRCGSSADLAHLLIAVVRAWGVPARYATGYLDPDFFEPDEDEEDARAHAQSLRAWTDVLIPGAGWRGFDPAEGLVVNDTYVRVAVGRDAGDVLQERAVFRGEGVQFERRALLDVSRVA